MFHVIEELPLKDQQELTRNLGVDPTKRTTRKVAFYNARAEYLDNRIIELDDDDNILRASGFIVPDDGQAGFAKASCSAKGMPPTVQQPFTRTSAPSSRATSRKLVARGATSSFHRGQPCRSRPSSEWHQR